MRSEEKDERSKKRLVRSYQKNILRTKQIYFEKLIMEGKINSALRYLTDDSCGVNRLPPWCQGQRKDHGDDFCIEILDHQVK